MPAGTQAGNLGRALLVAAAVFALDRMLKI